MKRSGSVGILSIGQEQGRWWRKTDDGEQERSMSDTRRGVIAPGRLVNIRTVVAGVNMDAHKRKRCATSLNAENAIEISVAGMHIHESLVISFAQ